MLVLLLCLCLGAYAYRHLSTTAPPDFPTEVITEDITVAWTDPGGPHFDPWNRCPDDFFNKGFRLLQKRLADGNTVNFLYHRGRKLLYRIDQDIIRGIPKIGLHWVRGTKYGAKYRIADPTFVGGKSVSRPTGTTTSSTATYHYGDAVSKRQSKPGREFFRATHIDTDNCPDWFTLFTFAP